MASYPEQFPAERLSQPKYKVKCDKDVMVRMRDGVMVAVDVFRPDAPGKFPVLYASSPYQKNLVPSTDHAGLPLTRDQSASSGSSSAATFTYTRTSAAPAYRKASGSCTARSEQTTTTT